MNMIIRILVLICSNLLFTAFFLGASLLSIYFNANFFATIGSFLPQGNLVDVSFLKSLPLLGFILPTKEVIKEIVIDGQITNKTLSLMPASQLSVLCVGLLFDLVKCFSSMLKNAQLAKGDLDGAAKWKVKGMVLFIISICATTGSFYYAAVDSNNKKIILEETKQKIEELKTTLKEDKEIMQSNTAKGIVTATEKVSGARLDKDQETLKALENKRDQLLIHEANPISNTFLAALIGLSVAFVLEWVIKLTLLSLTFTRTSISYKRTVTTSKLSVPKMRPATLTRTAIASKLNASKVRIKSAALNFNRLSPSPNLTSWTLTPLGNKVTSFATNALEIRNSSNFENINLTKSNFNTILPNSFINKSKPESVEKKQEKITSKRAKNTKPANKVSKSIEKQSPKALQKTSKPKATKSATPKAKSKTSASSEKKSDSSTENGSWLTNKIKEMEEKKLI